MEERVGFVVSSVEELGEEVKGYVRGEGKITECYQGQGKRSREGVGLISQDDEVKEAIVNKWVGQRKLSKLLELWVKGLEVDWSKLYGAEKPQRMRLPVYPFARERYWIDRTDNNFLTAKALAQSVLHPLLHNNTSDFNEQRYSSTFTGDEFFLSDHLIRTDDNVQKILPGVAYLEMARAAVEQACEKRTEGSLLELRHTVWAQPLVVRGARQVHVALLANEDEEIEYDSYSSRGEEQGGEAEKEKEGEIVHCQGRAVWSSGVSPAPIDLEQLRREIGKSNRQVLAQLRMPQEAEDQQGDYVLHPSLMDGALQERIGFVPLTRATPPV